MRLELSRFVEADLDEIADYIAQDNPRRAVTFVREIGAKFREIQRNPLIYRLRPEIGEDARVAVVGNHAILFRVIGDVVRIERVTYGGRDLPSLFEPS
jgi:plasmid stabilization system protein ParE